jgi:hypothetical protein
VFNLPLLYARQAVIFTAGYAHWNSKMVASSIVQPAPCPSTSSSRAFSTRSSKEISHLSLQSLHTQPPAERDVRKPTQRAAQVDHLRNTLRQALLHVSKLPAGKGRNRGSSTAFPCFCLLSFLPLCSSLDMVVVQYPPLKELVYTFVCMSISTANVLTIKPSPCCIF